MIRHYRELLRQREILAVYLEGGRPSWTEIEAGLYLSRHAREPVLPDHYLANQKRWLGGAASLDEGIERCFAGAAGFLEPAAGGRLAVPADRFKSWQDLLLDLPPLPIVAYALLREDRRRGLGLANRLTPEAVERLLAERIRPQVFSSALPTVDDPRLDYLARCHGFDEMHLHLNGSSEVEPVWIGAMTNLLDFIAKLKQGLGRARVSELFQQEERGLTQAGLVRRLKLARQLRAELTGRVLLPLAGLRFRPIDPFQTDTPYPFQWSHRTHPVDVAFGPIDAPVLSKETLLLMAVFAALPRSGEDLAHIFYAYLLILAQLARLLVQQHDQYGFDQFQKISDNEIRQSTEEHYQDRFHQLARTEEGEIDLLEGRFAPKADPERLIALLTRILAGYHAYHGRPLKHPTLARLLRQPPPELGSGKRMRLTLVGHFIKQRDPCRWELPCHACRHYALRGTIERQARVLLAVLARFPGLRRYLTGFDAAANELETPPEVFAPVFRRLRLAGFSRFTFHAGEDFVHLLSGIRAVHEAILFLDLGAGDRLGHATAVGIDPALWRRRVGSTVYVEQGEWLDNLVLARQLLRDTPLAQGAWLDDQIDRLSLRIHGTSLSADLLARAWRMRDLDPRIVSGVLPTDQEPIDPAHREERERWRRRAVPPEVEALFLRYHGSLGDSEGVRRSREPIAIEAGATTRDGFADFPEAALVALQERVLDQIRQRRIAIETLPTSNLRISVYQDYAEHHVLRWLGLHGGQPVPVCVGTDDPGIFATSLRNEYAHLLREIEATWTPRAAAPSPVALIEELIRNGKIWRWFPDPVSPPAGPHDADGG